MNRVVLCYLNVWTWLKHVICLFPCVDDFRGLSCFCLCSSFQWELWAWLATYDHHHCLRQVFRSFWTLPGSLLTDHGQWSQKRVSRYAMLLLLLQQRLAIILASPSINSPTNEAIVVVKNVFVCRGPFLESPEKPFVKTPLFLKAGVVICCKESKS